MRFLLNLLRDTRGVGGIEYMLLASLISVAAIAAIDEVGGSVNAQFKQVDSKF